MSEIHRARVPAPRVAPVEIHTAAPALGWYSDNILFGEIWERPGLDKRSRSIVTVAALMTRNHVAQLTGHFNRALTHGLAPSEIVELVTHMAFYAGWPCAMSAVGVMSQVFASRQVNPVGEQSLSTLAAIPDSMADAPAGLPANTGLLDTYREFVVEGDLWKRSGLAPRDRALATFSAIVAQEACELLPDELGRALRHGLTAEELMEAVTHLAFYVGWPKAAIAQRALSTWLTAQAASTSHSR
jgi:4-carboxymuconolactone decarboxylase